MKAILHIINYAASYRGNFIDSLENLNERLKRKHLHIVYLFTKDAQQKMAMEWIQEMVDRGEKVYFLNENSSQDSALIKSIMAEHQVVAIHTHFITMQQYLSIYRATMFSLIPVIMHMHNHSKKAKNPVKCFLRRLLYRKCKMVACSESVLESLKRDYPKNEKYVIDNGVNFQRLEKYSVLQNCDFKLPEGDKVFLIFGFDFYRKGVDLAVRAMNKLREERYPYALLISLSTNFEQVKDNIVKILGEFPDWIRIIPARNDVATLYNYVDLFLSPSREEGLPYSVIEAAYSKCSVVMSDISAQVHLRVPYGYWFESENVNALAQQIVKAEQEHEQKIRNWEEAKVEMQTNYALETWSQKVEELYQHIIK